MRSKAILLALGVLLAQVVGAQTIFKYRQPDGQVLYSNRPVPALELIETFDYKFAEPASASPRMSESDAASETRIRKYLDNLHAAWTEVQEATKALNAAQARLAAGVAPLETEGTALGAPAPPPEGGEPPPGVLAPAAPEAGGPLPPASPAGGGPLPAAIPAVGGPLGTRHGGGRNVEYVERIKGLQADLDRARARLDTALRRYNELR